MDNNLERRVAELERKLANYERIFVVTPTLMSVKTNLRIEGTTHADRLYRRGNTGNYSEVTT